MHPGYGFLSENAGFAQAVIEAGLTWIGPPVDAISSMGSKIEAKKLMAAAGVPVLAELTPAEVSAADLPVLVKASAGGGGRGMRVVTRLEDLPGEIEAASAEALSAFGDGTVFCEPYLASGRHIEVQIMADQHGTIWAVGERECSIQRRHQKVIEEAPSPLVERIPSMRAELFDAARKAAAAIGYVGAGTVEFLADEAGAFYFLEMNTRLQVEHPVTEETTGLDLVALQFAIAAGDALPAEPPATVGHAIEVRLYAEDPAHDWQPQTGTLHRFQLGHAAEVRTGVGPRPVCRGCASTREWSSGTEVSPYYDAMLAKVIVSGADPRPWRRRLAAELRAARIHGVGTNRDLLVRILRHPRLPRRGHRHRVLRAARARGAAGGSGGRSELSCVGGGAWRDAAAAGCGGVQRVPSGWRNVPSQPQRKSLSGGRVDVRGGLPADPGRAGCREDDVQLVDAQRRSGWCWRLAAYGGRSRLRPTTGWCVWTRRSGRWR